MGGATVHRIVMACVGERKTLVLVVPKRTQCASATGAWQKHAITMEAVMGPGGYLSTLYDIAGQRQECLSVGTTVPATRPGPSPQIKGC